MRSPPDCVRLESYHHTAPPGNGISGDRCRMMTLAQSYRCDIDPHSGKSRRRMAGKSQTKPFTPTQEKLFDFVVKRMSRLNTWAYRLSGGKIGGRWSHGEPIMLLTYTGRKSGQRYTKPLVYMRDGDTIVTVASKAGVSKNPMWYLNLEANPDCEVEMGREKRRMRARVASAEERARYWPQLAKMNPDFEIYKARTTREFPILLLTPR
jgi:deazaflavin-dependent oxidoreductase (nitroreductase family)